MAVAGVIFIFHIIAENTDFDTRYYRLNLATLAPKTYFWNIIKLNFIKFILKLMSFTNLQSESVTLRLVTTRNYRRFSISAKRSLRLIFCRAELQDNEIWEGVSVSPTVGKNVYFYFETVLLVLERKEQRKADRKSQELSSLEKNGGKNYQLS